MTVLALVEPPDHSPNKLEGLSTLKRKHWKKRIDLFMKREYKMEENLLSLYSIIWGQCSEDMQ